eukprot:3649902-Pyramimonas_sp.AAC.1
MATCNRGKEKKRAPSPRLGRVTPARHNMHTTFCCSCVPDAGQNAPRFLVRLLRGLPWDNY